MWECRVHMKARSGKEQGLVSLCEEWMRDAQSKGCIAVELVVDDSNPFSITLNEKWRSKEHFEANAVAEFNDRELMARFQAVCAGMPEVEEATMGKEES